jgi:hypothetical protein
MLSSEHRRLSGSRTGFVRNESQGAGVEEAMKAALRGAGSGWAGRALARVVIGTVAMALLTVGCSHEDGMAACSDAAVDFRLPTESLTDWVSYSDQLSVVDVVAEHRLWPVAPEPGVPPSDYVGRRVDIRVGDTPWRRPSAPAAPGRVSMFTDGWSIRAGLEPATIGEGPRLEVGRRYLMALVRYDEGDWGAFPRATLPIGPDGTLTRTCSNRPTLGALRGLTGTEAGQLLADTPPDPRAVAQAHLPPVQRLWTAQAQGRLVRSPG